MELHKIKRKAFTLVELIIVITILAILATIAFVSFQSYTRDARDTQRISNTKNIKDGLDLFSLQAGSFPSPDNIYGSGIISGVLLSYVGEIGDKTTALIKIKSTPKDPLTKNNIIYGVSYNNQKYQIATLLEKASLSYNPIVNQAYADAGYISKVDGNYEGLLKVNNSLYNLPSLLFTGSGNLISTDTYFIINGGQNLPYVPAAGVEIKNQTTSQVLKQLTGNPVTLTGVVVTDFTAQSTTLRDTLGYSVDKIGQSFYGKDYAPATSTSSAAVPITQTTCSAAGWYWVNDATDTIGNGYCISPRVTGGSERISWMDIGSDYGFTRTGANILSADPAGASNTYGVTYDLGNYSCKSIGTATSDFDTSDTLLGRMKWLVINKDSSSELDSIDWVTVPGKPSTFSVPALMLSDCIDGVRNLSSDYAYEGVSYAQYSNPTNDVVGRQNMNKYLLGWTKSSGSHLPSAFSDISSETTSPLTINKGEYQIACEAGKFPEGADPATYIWFSSLGTTGGLYWGRAARIGGRGSCSAQDFYNTDIRPPSGAARFVIR